MGLVHIEWKNVACEVTTKNEQLCYIYTVTTSYSIFFSKNTSRALPFIHVKETFAAGS